MTTPPQPEGESVSHYCILIALLLVASLDIFILHEESLYLPLGRYPGSESLADGCMLLPILSMAVIASLMTSDLDAAPKRRRIMYPLYVAIALAVLGGPMIPPAYLLHRSRNEFLQFLVAPQVQPDPQPAAGERPLFVLLSDIHVTDQKHTLENFPPDKERFRTVLTYALALHPQYGVLSGDLTDRGAEGEWHIFESVVSASLAHPQQGGSRLLFIPGNHDLQGAPAEGIETAGYVDHNQFELPFLERENLFFQQMTRWESKLRPVSVRPHPGADFLIGLTSVRAKKVESKIYRIETGGGDDKNVRPPIIVVEYPKGFDDLVEATKQAFNSFFPLVDQSPENEVALVLLNSASKVRPGGSMGLGDLGDEQLARLKIELDSLKRNIHLKVLIVALHHAPVRHQTDAWDWRQALRKRTNSDIFEHTFLALNVIEAAKLVETLEEFAKARQDVDVVVLHGHRHQRYLGKTPSGIWVVEAPALVESENGFWAGYNDSGRLRVRWIDGPNP